MTYIETEQIQPGEVAAAVWPRGDLSFDIDADGLVLAVHRHGDSVRPADLEDVIRELRHVEEEETMDEDPLLDLRMAVVKLQGRAEETRLDLARSHGGEVSYAQAMDGWLGGPIGEYAGLFTPEAGLELAGWLDSVVKRLDGEQPGQEARGEGPIALADKAAAFTIARALLGRQP